MTDINQVKEWRRTFHRYPEVSYKEFETTKRIRHILEDNDIKIVDYPLQTGLVAEVGQGDTIVALRTDIDALPITEQTHLDIQSTTEGVMHACGHDIHMATILAATMKLKAQEATLPGRVRILFQAAEEVGSGAQQMVEAGVLEDVKVVTGFHNDPTLKIGEFAIKPGAMTSAVDRFAIRIQGKGGHAAKPEESNDPMIILGQLMTSIQSIVSRNISAFDSAVVTIGEVSAGNTWNVIPDQAYIQGTVRTFNAETREKTEKRMQDICDGLASAFNAEIELEYIHLPNAVINDEVLTQKAIEAAKDTGFNVEHLKEPKTIGEDFSAMSDTVPGVFAFIGSESEYDLHHPKYNPDERILEKAPDYLVGLIQKLF
ncbi:amidohydrolase [Staphylococcus carnosus]|uniref:Amino acid amidohydrolase n=2 Tax=Staphylococcus carnosus TaxID=1281 RepID=B9DLS0_STACT|nr:amidohydrolase [Staphylococcus carnosus]KKB25350.1 N-acetyl-L,L-diaminopimelate deacetylase [Staphylococcus carnosus]KOR12868.1 N-acetyl-L,L-diaminopimelate deacetylase [Staphylococcus carnosus]POA07463.1 amidohydrolase [Staphylococcus carnosus]QPT04814.1 amidohydrolase [Staphylococcus carnosus]QQS84565.1 amidohydrolase [Staphylococcus carnosus]